MHICVRTQKQVTGQSSCKEVDETFNTLMYLLSEGYFKKAIDHSNAVVPKSRNPEKKTIYRKHSLFHKRSSIWMKYKANILF